MAKKNTENSICFPGESTWELWTSKEDRFGGSDYELSDVKALDESGSCEPFKQATHYAFPFNFLFALFVQLKLSQQMLQGLKIFYFLP